MRCHYTPYCASVHVNKASFQCELSSYYPLEEWLPAKTRSGWNVYYMADLVYGACYWYTARDLSYIVKEPGSFDAMCESYPYHTATHVDLMSGKCYCNQTKGCYVSSSRNYSGTWSKTKSGINCQRWDYQDPHTHQMTSASMFPEDGNITNARFYCRDPDNSGELWCYTVDPSVRREICVIPKCSP